MSQRIILCDERREGLVPSRLLSKVCDLYDVSEPELCSKRRMPDIVKARWALSYALIEFAGWSMPRIGKLLSKDHTSILYGYRRACGLYRSCPAFFSTVSCLEREVFIR